LKIAESRLARVDAEREVLTNLITNLKQWQNVSTGSDIPQSATDVQPRRRRRGTSLRAYVQQVFENNPNRIMHSSEILEEAKKLGGYTESGQPINVVDRAIFQAQSFLPIEKVGPRLWRYTAKEAVPA